MKTALLILLLVSAAVHAEGTLYRCKLPGGSTTYLSQPCVGGKALRLDDGPSKEQVADAQERSAALVAAVRARDAAAGKKRKASQGTKVWFPAGEWKTVK